MTVALWMRLGKSLVRLGVGLTGPAACRADRGPDIPVGSGRPAPGTLTGCPDRTGRARLPEGWRARNRLQKNLIPLLT